MLLKIKLLNNNEGVSKCAPSFFMHHAVLSGRLFCKSACGSFCICPCSSVSSVPVQLKLRPVFSDQHPAVQCGSQLLHSRSRDPQHAVFSHPSAHLSGTDADLLRQGVGVLAPVAHRFFQGHLARLLSQLSGMAGACSTVWMRFSTSAGASGRQPTRLRLASTIQARSASPSSTCRVWRCC